MRFILDLIETVRGDISQRPPMRLEKSRQNTLSSTATRDWLLHWEIFCSGVRYELSVDVDEMVNFMLSVAREEISRKDVEAWLRSRSRKTQ